MPKLIFTVAYHTNHQKSVGHLLEYMGKREGVEKLQHPSELLSYIGERPMVETLGQHGLFSATDEPVHLNSEKKKIDAFGGNIYTAVVSLKREDADRLCYNCVSGWIPTIRAQMMNVAKQMKISEDELKWFAAYHDHPKHPHCHILFYSPFQKVWLTKKGIENIRRGFVQEVLSQDLIQLYSQKQTLRNDLKIHTRAMMKNLVNSQPTANPEMEHLLLSLSDDLASTGGKKVYGYLKPALKRKVNTVFQLLSEDQTARELYRGWCEIQSEIIKSYRSQLDSPPPLVKQKEFHSIRNQIIQAALSLSAPRDSSETQPVPEIRRALSANSVLSLLNFLSKLVYNDYEHKHKRVFEVDRKLMSQIAEKKLAHGQRMSGNDGPKLGM